MYIKYNTEYLNLVRQCGGVVKKMDGAGYVTMGLITSCENVAIVISRKIDNLYYIRIICITYTSNKQELNNGRNT